MYLQRLLFLGFTTSVLLSCSASTKAQTHSKPAFATWDKKMIALGTVKKGEKRTMFFDFTNTSGEDIQIEIVDACACTETDFPRGVLAPGAKGRIDAIFDSTEKTGPETIDIRIIFKNTDAAGVPKIEVVQYSFDLDF